MSPKTQSPNLLEELKASLVDADPETRAVTMRLVKYVESLRNKPQGYKFRVPMFAFSSMLEQTATATLLNWLEVNGAPEPVATLVKNIQSIQYYIKLLENPKENAYQIEEYEAEALLLETAEAITLLGGSWRGPFSGNISQPIPDLGE